MFVLLTIGTGGAVVFGPFIGVAVYYLFAVLRPQHLWKWALLIDLRWSLYVAIVTILSTCIYLPGGLRGKTFTSTHAAFFGFALWVTLSNIFALNSEISSFWYWEYFKIFIMFFCATFRRARIEPGADTLSDRSSALRIYRLRDQLSLPILRASGRIFMRVTAGWTTTVPV